MASVSPCACGALPLLSIIAAGQKPCLRIPLKPNARLRRQDKVSSVPWVPSKFDAEPLPMLQCWPSWRRARFPRPLRKATRRTTWTHTFAPRLAFRSSPRSWLTRTYARLSPCRKGGWSGTPRFVGSPHRTASSFSARSNCTGSICCDQSMEPGSRHGS